VVGVGKVHKENVVEVKEENTMRGNEEKEMEEVKKMSERIKELEK
jgi:hypothetical protein